ncbi:hypothetical protein [Pseudomonas sp. 9Ag]|uniref:hypothetical protein n=1 Tax=Pseudomonas sp. 9Ag TaxID=2653167 RepID=UPI0013577E56|nr:hypothetical protein [Pseudomonas sp. 9Ag]
MSISTGLAILAVFNEVLPMQVVCIGLVMPGDRPATRALPQSILVGHSSARVAA